MAERRRYDEDFREQLTLRDGSVVYLRVGRSDDKELLRRGFEQLSAESRYQRFLTPKNILSEKELSYLSRLDGDDHFAIGALSSEGAETGEKAEVGVGVGRFVRLPHTRNVAEPAISVVDAFQGKGLGSILLQHLIAAAKERGITRFQCIVLASNEPVRRLLEASDAEVVGRQTSLGFSEVTLALPDTSSIERVRQSAVHQLLTHAAGGSRAIALGRQLLAALRLLR